MLKFISKLLKERAGSGKRSGADPLDDNNTAPIYESLAMTDELREALFPITPQMVSAIFDRPAPLNRPQAPSPARSEAGFPIIF